MLVLGMLFRVNDYIYDSNREILYKRGVSITHKRGIIRKYDTDIAELKSKKIISFDRKLVKKAGIVLTANCNLRCNYCSQCSVEGYQEKIDIQAIRLFVDDIMVD